MSGTRRLPVVPRHATWKRSLRRRWPLALIGMLLVLVGAVAQGTTSGSTRDLALGLILTPGIAVVMVWLRGVMRLRVLLTNGVETPAVVVERADGRRIRYLYHDGDGREHRGETTVDDEARLGSVVHDPDEPGFHVLAHADDFVEDPSS